MGSEPTTPTTSRWRQRPALFGSPTKGKGPDATTQARGHQEMTSSTHPSRNTPLKIQRQPRIRLRRSDGCAPLRGRAKRVGGGPYFDRAVMIASATFFGASE